MSDTYEWMQKMVKEQQQKGEVNHSRDSDHPQQDFSYADKLTKAGLSEKSPEDYELPGDDGAEYQREIAKRELP